MTCQRRGTALACIVLGAALPAFALVRAQTPASDTRAPSSATATAAPGAGRQPSAAAASGATLPPLPLSPDAVLEHIKRTLDWYRDSQALQEVPQLSMDVVERDGLRQTALTSLRLAFDFGRAAATQIAAAGGAGLQKTGPAAASARNGAASANPIHTSQPVTSRVASGSATSVSSASAAAGGAVSAAQQQSQHSLDAASARIAARTMELQSQLSALDARLARAPTRTRAAVRAERDQVAAALALEREVQTTVGELQRFQSSFPTMQGSGAKDLLGQIADLERTVPEVRQGGSAAASASGGSTPGGQSSGSSGIAGAGRTAGTQGTGAGSGAAATVAAFHPESAGIIALITQWISLQNADSHLDDMLKSTDGLNEEFDALRAPLVAQARTLAREDTSGVDSTDPAQLESSRRMLEAAAARFRQLAAVLVPLGDQDFVLDSARATLIEWRSALRARIGVVARTLLMRLIILGTLILAVFVISEIWRRAVFKYLHDARRRSQFQTLRRVIIGVLLAVVILFALVEQLGSLATYVGFLTAGLAVALQNVILSIVGYFFLIGRYGVRVGDRITLAGVTGRVVDIGLVRIYLMELAGPELRSTGRIVVLSNSVLFQPQALFKQIPGADYLWHTISLTLAPSVEVQAAQQRLKATADEVFEHYRGAIDEQHAAVRRLVDFDTAAPCPEVRVRFAEHGWHFDIRYPVHAEQAARIDQRMLKAVRGAVADAEQFPVVDSGTPVLQAEA